MSENWQSEPVKTTHQMRSFFIYVALLILAFLLGLVPMWLKSGECSNSLAEAERQSSLIRMENSLAAATIDARRGDYETARLAASDFFTFLRVATNEGVESALSEEDIASLQPLLSRRDEIITLPTWGSYFRRSAIGSVCVLSPAREAVRQGAGIWLFPGVERPDRSRPAKSTTKIMRSVL